MANFSGGSGWSPASGSGEIAFALKTFYLPAIENQLQNSTILLSRIQRNTKDVSGDYAQFPIILGRNVGLGARGDRNPLAKAGYQVGAKARVPMKYNFGSIAFTLQAILASKNAQGAYDSVIDLEMEGIEIDLPKDINRQLYCNGGFDGANSLNSALARVAGTPTAGAVCTVDNVDLVNTYNDGAGSLTKYLQVGQYVSFISNTDYSTRNATGKKITAVTATTFTVDDTTGSGTVASTAGIDNDIVCLSSADSTTANPNDSWQNEMEGLFAMVSTTGTYQNINRATAGNERWQALVLSNSGVARPLSLALMQQAVSKAEQIGGGRTSLILGTYEARDSYVSQLVADKRYVNTMTLDGGFQSVEFNGLPFVPDADAPAGHLWVLDESPVSIYQESGLEFMDLDGSTLHRASGYAAYEATIYWASNMGTRKCIPQVRIADLDV